MTGAELAAYARGKYPHLNIILMSGTATSPLPSNTLFLQKPFLPGNCWLPYEIDSVQV